jgi:NAD(P)-dependent dehydrogenase (short-subunit alcohol dehydrogenase family)
MAAQAGGDVGNEANLSPRSLDGRRIIITGGASGIGKATALLFARHGAHIAIFDQNGAGAIEVASATGGTAMSLDLADDVAVEGAVTTAAAALGGLDGIVNAAAMTFRGTVRDASPEHWRRVLDVNLVGPFLVCRAAIPFLEQASTSTIVNVSSGTAMRAVPGRSAYAASKAGLIQFTRGLAQELGPRIRVNVVCPGPVDTPLYRFANKNAAADQGGVDLALKRIGSPEEIAATILFLTSPRSSFVTGAVLLADGGGQHAMM